ncbi:putative glucose-repressible alcohol dehydrogenase transcriptional effector [Erysiphe neolycopersici]|uniref:Putative glucose-repressible alcohol dehydrogenase transcriptional effector n=1 Tax=Erysiphe neolycopersici TaxID=212602 RepID=A0A420HPF1_9PEZI|nr:putative glucose-repressible alcohol dehydrogenase transcriptional effector [Erysiphe neolycopersici]
MAYESYQLPDLASEKKSEYSTHTLKRPRFGSPTFSNDPDFSSDPIFSSEDEDPSSENYIQERNKKKLRGPWFCHHSRSSYDVNGGRKSTEKRRQFKRNFDSGIFMGSDFSDNECLESSMLSNSSKLSTPSRTPFITPLSENFVYQKIQTCLEEGNEIIDLSSQGLTSLPNEAIKQLSSFTRVPADTEGIFSILEPALKIFLASNRLETLPYELFNLAHLEVLSLRGNSIHELPPKIGNLLKLKELNLSQNKLCYLPYEILSLLSSKGSLEKLILHPNFFYEPKYLTEYETQGSSIFTSKSGLTVCNDKSDSLHKNGDKQNIYSNDRWKISYQARTDIRFIDINGNLIKGPNFSTPDCLSFPDPILVAREDYRPNPPNPRNNGFSRAHSLLETALATCAKTTQLPYLSLQLPDDTPSYLRDLLDLAVTNKELGGTFCTICQRKYIIARTEWIEWWEISKVKPLTSKFTQNHVFNDRDDLERFVPLIRRGCSWLCTPSAVD